MILLRSLFATLALSSVVAQAAPIIRRPGGSRNNNAELKSPPSFPQAGGQAVYVDFESARYSMEFDIAQKVTTFTSRIQFRMPSAGYPVFDLVGTTMSVLLDGTSAQLAEVSPPGSTTKVRLISRVLQPGSHTLDIVHRYVGEDQRYAAGTVNFGVWTSDLSDRNFLEQYLPTSFEYDNYSMEIDINIIGAGQEHVLLTNAKSVVRARNRDGWSVKAPGTYMTSSLYLHLTPKSAIRSVSGNYRSTSGKDIPILAYAKTTMSDADLRLFVTDSQKHLAELEGKFGAWPHDQLLIYAQPSGGGMEYNGATITSHWALGHEIAHSYLGRGFFPANGDAGWLDEAINSWRDSNYPTIDSPGRLSRTNMAGRGVYVRLTDSRAYGAGANFIAHLHHVAAPKGGLHPFLKDFIAQNLFRSVYTVDFQKALEAYVGQSLQSLFNEKVYGRSGNFVDPRDARTENPHHPKWTPAYRRSLL